MCTAPKYNITDFATCGPDGRPTRFMIGHWQYERNKTAWKPPRFKVDKVPCQDCMECRMSKAAEWKDRGMVELEDWEKSCMITLTYDDDNLPKSSYIDEKTGELCTNSTLSIKDHKNFIKRLRKSISGEKIKILMCGEYGSAETYEDRFGNERVGTERPHYHYIIYGHDFDDKKFYKWSYNEWSKEKNPLYKSEELNKLWPKGHADINEVTPESIGYVAGYVTKKLKGQMAEEEYTNKNRTPPFLITSKRIGENYFKKNKEKFYEKKKLYKKTKKGLQTIKLSRYYLKLIEKENEKKAREIKRDCQKRSNMKMDMILQNTSLTENEYIQQSHEISEKLFGGQKRGCL